MSNVFQDTPDWTQTSAPLTQNLDTVSITAAGPLPPIPVPPWSAGVMFVQSPAVVGITPTPLTLQVVGTQSGITYASMVVLSPLSPSVWVPLPPGVDQTVTVTVAFVGAGSPVGSTLTAYGLSVAPMLPTGEVLTVGETVGNAHGLPATTVILGASGAPTLFRLKSVTMLLSPAGGTQCVATLQTTKGGSPVFVAYALTYGSTPVGLIFDVDGFVNDPGVGFTLNALLGVDTVSCVISYTQVS